jgi:hypothetical protein
MTGRYENRLPSGSPSTNFPKFGFGGPSDEQTDVPMQYREQGLLALQRLASLLWHHFSGINRSSCRGNQANDVPCGHRWPHWRVTFGSQTKARSLRQTPSRVLPAEQFWVEHPRNSQRARPL